RQSCAGSHRRSARTRFLYLLRPIAKRRRHKLKIDKTQNVSLLLRAILVLAMLTLAVILRVAPHPWNFTPIGAMALFSGAMVRDRRMAFLLAMVAMLAGDLFIGFNKLSPLVYA